MIYNWRLSPVEPFAWETQRYAGPAQFPLLDMHKSIHLVTLSDGELSGNIGGGGFEFHAGDFYLTLNAEPNIGAVYNKLQPALRKLFLSTEQLTLRDAAGECCLSIDYFSHLFKQCFGISFAAYELNYRLNQAADCMLKKRYSLKEVARIYGFSDKSHFCRSFRQWNQITPLNYRRRQ